MEYIIDETIPTFWKQGYFFFGDQKRIATVTDVKFISDSKLIVAHRAAAKLYLVEIIDDIHSIKDTLLLKYGNKHYHPDEMAIKDNMLIMTSYENISCVVNFDILNNKLSFVKIFQIHKYIQYHGCCISRINNNLIYYGGVRDKDYNTPMTVYDFDTNTSIDIKTNYNGRIKTISLCNDGNILLGLDELGKKDKNNVNLFNSLIVIYSLEKNQLTLLDSIEIEKSQIDGSVIYNNYFFVTLHCGIDKCGYIYIGKIDKDKLIFVKKVKCNNFPHGIDVHNNRLAYTSYTSSSVIIHTLDEFIKL